MPRPPSEGRKMLRLVDELRRENRRSLLCLAIARVSQKNPNARVFGRVSESAPSSARGRRIAALSSLCHQRCRDGTIKSGLQIAERDDGRGLQATFLDDGFKQIPIDATVDAGGDVRYPVAALVGIEAAMGQGDRCEVGRTRQVNVHRRNLRASGAMPDRGIIGHRSIGGMERRPVQVEIAELPSDQIDADHFGNACTMVFHRSGVSRQPTVRGQHIESLLDVRRPDQHVDVVDEASARRRSRRAPSVRRP